MFKPIKAKSSESQIRVDKRRRAYPEELKGLLLPQPRLVGLALFLQTWMRLPLL